MPHLGMPTAWMMKITTWQKKTKKKKKKLTELSVLKQEAAPRVTSFINGGKDLIDLLRDTSKKHG